MESKDIVSKLSKRMNSFKKNTEKSQPSFQNLLKEQLLNIKKERKNMMKEFDKKENPSDE